MATKKKGNVKKKKTAPSRPTKVFIVGCSTTRDEVPWQEVRDGKAEAWGVNNLFHSMPLKKFPFTRWFEIHGITKDKHGNFLRRDMPEFRGQTVAQYISGGVDPNGNKVHGLATIGIPVYMQNLWPEIPNAIVYPLEHMLNAFGDYFTNSISYQLALAIEEGFKEIHVFGVDMAVSSPRLLHDEYAHQRPSVEYFLGIARGRGIKVYIPDTADLLKTRFLYGWDEPKQSKWDKKMDAMLKHIDHQQFTAENQLRDLQRKVDQAIGARLAIKEMSKVWQ
jgi:hypothetical protein